MIEHVKQYREAAAWLENYRCETMPINSVVHVNYRGRYTGFGISAGSARKPDHVVVLLESGNVAYPIECVRPIREDERASLPSWLNELGARV